MDLSILAEYKWVILFYSSVVLLVHLNRGRFEKQANFIYLMKTKLGLELMERASKRFGKAIRLFGYLGIIAAYLGFFLITMLLVKESYKILIQEPGAVGASPVIPGVPIAALGGIKIPLVIGWISIFIIMIVHEFSHGIVAKAHGVDVKSSGVAFFGPILGAFVEPDENQLVKKPHRVQHSIFAAGPVSNVLLWGLAILLLLGVNHLIGIISYPEGVSIATMQNETLPAFLAGMPNKTVVTGINNLTVRDRFEMESALSSLSPNESIVISTKDGNFDLVLSAHPDNASKAYLGVWILGTETKLKHEGVSWRIYHGVLNWLLALFSWVMLLSINIGLINLFPVFITDGARMLKLNFEYLFRKNIELGRKLWYYTNLLGVLIVMILISKFFIGLFEGLFSLLNAILIALLSLFMYR